MLYLFSLTTFIIYNFSVRALEHMYRKLLSIKLNSSYNILYECQREYKLATELLLIYLLPLFFQQIIVFLWVIYIMNTIYKVYKENNFRHRFVLLFNINKTVLGFLLIIDTSINIFKLPIISYIDLPFHIFYTTMNIISIYLISNEYNVENKLN